MGRSDNVHGSISSAMNDKNEKASISSMERIDWNGGAKEQTIDREMEEDRK